MDTFFLQCVTLCTFLNKKLRKPTANVSISYRVVDCQISTLHDCGVLDARINHAFYPLLVYIGCELAEVERVFKRHGKEGKHSFAIMYKKKDPRGGMPIINTAIFLRIEEDFESPSAFFLCLILFLNVVVVVVVVFVFRVSFVVLFVFYFVPSLFSSMLSVFSVDLCFDKILIIFILLCFY